MCCTLQSPCCGEFMVSRERILRYSREQYQLLLDRLVALKAVRKYQKNKKKADGFRAAYVLEQAWCALNISSSYESDFIKAVQCMAQEAGLVFCVHVSVQDTRACKTLAANPC